MGIEDRRGIADFEKDGVPPSNTKIGWNGNYAHRGLDVTVGAGGFELEVSSGVAVIQGRVIEISAQSVSVTPPLAGGHHELALIIADATGRVSVISRGQSNFPSYPPVPDDAVPVAGVFIQSITPPVTALDASEVMDKRPAAPVTPSAA